MYSTNHSARNGIVRRFAWHVAHVESLERRRDPDRRVKNRVPRSPAERLQLHRTAIGISGRPAPGGTPPTRETRDLADGTRQRQPASLSHRARPEAPAPTRAQSIVSVFRAFRSIMHQAVSDPATPAARNAYVPSPVAKSRPVRVRSSKPKFIMRSAHARPLRLSRVLGALVRLDSSASAPSCPGARRSYTA